MKQTENEQEISELIMFLGDIIIKSVRHRETEVSKEGIDKLTNITIKFLELKDKNEEKYKTEGDVFGDAKNNYVSYVLHELEKIFREALNQKDSITTRHLMSKLMQILDKTMSGGSNFQILTKIIDTRNVLGSTYTKLLGMSLSEQNDFESSFLTQHLASIPKYAIFENRYDFSYLTQFIEYHVYRMVKTIIEHDDFKAFSAVLDHFFNQLRFNDPADLARRISGSMYFLVTKDKEVKDKIDKIVFLLENQCMKQFSTIAQVDAELDELLTIANQKFEPEEIKATDQRIQKIKSQLHELYITSLVHGVFFRIGALLLSKGTKYDKYIQELWYHGKPNLGQGTIINSTPVSESIKWNTLYSMYSGNNQIYIDEFYMFEDFSDAAQYHYQYCSLLMIRYKQFFSFDTSKISKLKIESKKEQFDFFYELASLIKTEEFKQAISKLKERENILKIIRTSDVKENIEVVENQLKKIESDREKVLEILIKYGEVDSAKIDTVKKSVQDAYFKDSLIDKICAIDYDPELENFEEMNEHVQIRRDHFIDQDFMGMFLMDPVIAELSHQELVKALSTIQKGIEEVSQDTFDFEEQVKSSVKVLQDNGKTPDVIFLPLDVETELMKKGMIDFGQKRRLKVNGTDIMIINSWKRFDFTDIIIFDSNYFKATYKAKDKKDRITTEVSSTEEGNEAVLFSSKVQLQLEIDDHSAFQRIINKNVIKLKEKYPE